MAQKCTVCSHESIKEINKALINGVAIRKISEQFGLTPSSIHRHRVSHLPETLVKAKEAKEVCESGELWTEMVSLKTTCIEILDKAKEMGEFQAAVSAIGQAIKIVVVMLKVQGELKKDQHVNISLLPEFLEFKEICFDVLSDYPDAKAALIDKLKNTQ